LVAVDYTVGVMYYPSCKGIRRKEADHLYSASYLMFAYYMLFGFNFTSHTLNVTEFPIHTMILLHGVWPGREVNSQPIRRGRPTGK
ncbi:hypothetical protein V3C99_004614, partial [Haemonchus contortus]